MSMTQSTRTSWLLAVAVGLGALCVAAASDDNSECNNNDDDEGAPTWITDGGFFALFLGVCAMFWGLAAGETPPHSLHSTLDSPCIT
jgi:hypothetical protein